MLLAGKVAFFECISFTDKAECLLTVEMNVSGRNRQNDEAVCFNIPALSHEFNRIVYINTTDRIDNLNYGSEVEFNRIVNVNSGHIGYGVNHTAFRYCMRGVDFA